MKAEVFKQEKMASKRSVSTKSLILQSANEIINKSGVLDFRIDTLSTSLKLSPGNITYHFPKKEDIISSIWEKCCREITSSSFGYITPLMDIKQLYIYYKFTILTLNKYRGVAYFKLGDSGEGNSLTGGGSFVKEWMELLSSIIDLLEENGYVEGVRDNYIIDMVQHSTFVNIFCSILATSTTHESRIFGADQYAAVAMYQLSPILTDKGKREMASVFSIINH